MSLIRPPRRPPQAQADPSLLVQSSVSRVSARGVASSSLHAEEERSDERRRERRGRRRSASAEKGGFCLGIWTIYRLFCLSQSHTYIGVPTLESREAGRRRAKPSSAFPCARHACASELSTATRLWHSCSAFPIAPFAWPRLAALRPAQLSSRTRLGDGGPPSAMSCPASPVAEAQGC